MYNVDQKLVDELERIPGNVRGAVIIENLNFLERKAGQERVNKVKQRFREFSCDIDLDNLKPLEFYPEHYSVLLILMVAEILDFKEEDVFKMGEESFKYASFIKFFVTYFVSIERCFKEAPKYWQRHFDFGKIEKVEFNGEERYAVFRVIGYKFHPIMCIYHKGCFYQIAQLAIGTKKVSLEETKCVFRGDPHHEYVIRW